MPITDQTANEVQTRLATVYGKLWNRTRGGELLRSFRREVDDAAYAAAVDAHIHNPECGQSPPTPADLERELVAIYAARKMAQRIEDSAKQRERAKLERARAALVGKIDYPRLVDEYAQKRAAIVQHIRKELCLDFLRPPHREVLQAALRAWMDSGGELSPKEAEEAAREWERAQFAPHAAQDAA